MPKYAKYSFTAIMCISCCMWVASGRAKNSLSPVWLCVCVCVCVHSGFTRFSRCVYYLRAVRTCVFVYFSRVCLCACVRLCNVKTTQCAVTFCLSTAESLWVRRLQHQPALCGPNTTRGRTLIRTDSSTESGRERRWGRHEGKTKKKKKETYLRIWHDVEFEFEDEGEARATNLYCTLYSLTKLQNYKMSDPLIFTIFLLSRPQFHST